MSAGSIPSNLSNAKYLYDFVVAITQESLNATMKEFLAQLTEPVISVCYVADEKGNPTRIKYEDLVNKTGTDPFSIPNDVDVSTSLEIQRLHAARFMVGFRAQLGLPHADPRKLHDIVQLGSSAASVKFNMYCSEFQVVQYSLAGYAPANWINLSQDPSAPWVFSSAVDLRLEQVPDAAYGKLPPAIQDKIQNLGPGAFSVQQLLFDLANATLQSIPTMSDDIKPGSRLDIALRTAFLGAYFTEMQKKGQPMLGCSIVASGTDTSTLKPTSLDHMVNSYLDDQNKEIGGPLTTLNYLCSIGGKRLPPATNFSWNWVPDSNAQLDHDGVISLNRETLADYFRARLMPYAQKNCLLVWTYCASEVVYNEYKWQITSGQTPTVKNPATGATVLSFTYSSSHSDSAAAYAGSFDMSNNYTMTVQFTGKTIVITQHQVVWIDVWNLANNVKGNIVDKTIVDTYNLAIDESGKLVVNLSPPTTTDKSVSPDINSVLNWFADVNSVIADIEDNVRSFASTQLQDIPVSIIQDFVFPGGRTFIFKDVGFSPYQDLVSYITYADVRANKKATTAPAAKTMKATMRRK